MTEWEVSIKKDLPWVPWDWFPLGRTYEWKLSRVGGKPLHPSLLDSGYAFTEKGARRAAERTARRLDGVLEPPETYRYKT